MNEKFRWCIKCEEISFSISTFNQKNFYSVDSGNNIKPKVKEEIESEARNLKKRNRSQMEDINGVSSKVDKSESCGMDIDGEEIKKKIIYFY